MNVVTRKHLAEAQLAYPDAAKELEGWLAIAKSARWKNFVELRRAFTDADGVGEYVVFNIRQNRYRLITIVHYSREKDGRVTDGHLYIRSFLTHKEYDNHKNWDKGVK